MSASVTAAHLAEFALLRFVANDLDDLERRRAERHLADCSSCREELERTRLLDASLRDVFRDAGKDEFGQESRLPAGDPYAQRPELRAQASGRNAGGPPGADLLASAFSFSRAGAEDAPRLLEAAASGEEAIARELESLDLDAARDRYCIQTALQKAGEGMSKDPENGLRLANRVLSRLEPPAENDSIEASIAERLVPLRLLAAGAQLLAGQACNWTGELDRGGWHLLAAWNLYGSAGATEFELALVELQESQRRSFASLPGEAIVLARRAAETFEEFGQEEWKARAEVTRGIALSGLERDEEALPLFRKALAVFNRLELWATYCSTLNSLGGSLRLLGRLEEARREYARALGRLAREDLPMVQALVYGNLATLLHRAGDYAGAARSSATAATLYAGTGMLLDRLLAELRRIESLACADEREEAFAALDAFRTEVASHGALDLSIVRALEACFAGAEPNFETLSQVLEEAEGYLRIGLSRRRSA